MTGSRPARRACGRAAARLYAVVAASTVLVAAAAPQAPQHPAGTAQPGAAQSGATPPPAASPANRPGFIDAFGHWIANSVTGWNSGIKDATDAAKDAADTAGSVTRDTAGAVARIPGARVIAERAICPTAPNGAPDCRVAA